MHTLGWEKKKTQIGDIQAEEKKSEEGNQERKASE